jgi:hypothetical protein
MNEKKSTEKELIEGPFPPKEETPRRVPLFGTELPTGRKKDLTMRIKLNRDWVGATDGIHVETHKAGAVVNFPEWIAAALLHDGRASLPEEEKSLAGAPENKMDPGPKSNKGGRKGK